MLVCGVIWLSFCLTTGIILVLIGFFQYRKWKVMEDTPTRMIVDIEPGRVEVNGNIQPFSGGLHYAPLSQKPCVQFDVQVQELRRSKNSTYWATIHTYKRGGVFLVVDESGKVLVDPKGGKLEKIQTLATHQGKFREMPPRVREYISRTGVETKGFFGVLDRTLRVVESIVPTDQHLYVLGDAVDDPTYHGFQNDPLISPFTIKKKKMMILSYKSEAEVSMKKKTAWVLLYVFGGLSALAGLGGLVFFIY